jgi:membrane protein
MIAFLHQPLSYRELFRRTIRETIADDAPGLAAELAYYFFLALFPALLGLLALASFFPLHNLTGEVTAMLEPVAPDAVIGIITQQMTRLANGDRSGLLSLGVVGALWSSSSAVTAVIDAMNRAYDIEESRSWLRVRVTSILLTIALALLVLIALVLVLAGPEMAEFVGRLGAGELFAWTWKILQWPLVFLLVTTAISLVYYFGPNADQEWVWVTPGSILASALWLIGSLGFRAYVANFGAYETTYGTVGGIIVLLTWFYVLGFVIVVGAEMNAEIEHASPWGRDRPRASARRKRCKVGLAACREYEKQGAAGRL